VQGDFTQFDFADEFFDKAYAIESTCHSPVLADAYKEIFRVLKKGGRFAAYEWIKAAGYARTHTHPHTHPPTHTHTHTCTHTHPHTHTHIPPPPPTTTTTHTHTHTHTSTNGLYRATWS
jgi:ubiquinone/menaquinone biosynthesis C-methylase UbiE